MMNRIDNRQNVELFSVINLEKSKKYLLINNVHIYLIFISIIFKFFEFPGHS